MPITRKSTTKAVAPKQRDEDDDYTDEDEDDAPEPAKRRGLGKAVRGSAAVAFKEGATEGSGRKASKATAADDDAEDDDDDDDEDGAAGAVKSGWAAARRAKQASSSFADEFKFDQDETLVKFIGDEPFAVFAQHWIDSGLSSTKKKSFICLGKGCPLCAIGDANPRPMFAFNIAVIDEDTVEVKALLAGTRLLGQIETAHGSKAGPLSKGFWALSRSGKKSSTAYTLQAVKPRDLKEDWGVELEEIEAEIEKAKPYDGSAYKPMTKAQLREIADELAEDED